jgi:hypothetical protein
MLPFSTASTSRMRERLYNASLSWTSAVGLPWVYGTYGEAGGNASSSVPPLARECQFPAHLTLTPFLFGEGARDWNAVAVALRLSPSLSSLLNLSAEDRRYFSLPLGTLGCPSDVPTNPRPEPHYVHAHELAPAIPDRTRATQAKVCAIRPVEGVSRGGGPGVGLPVDSVTAGILGAFPSISIAIHAERPGLGVILPTLRK